MSSPPRYADIYDYDHLTVAAQGIGLDEYQIMQLHNLLVWHKYRPKRSPKYDVVVCRCIEAVAQAKRTPLGSIKDPEVLELIEALF